VAFSSAILNNDIYIGSSPGVWSRSIPQIIAVKNISSKIPEKYELYQNYPNPFNPSTKIKFAIPEDVKRKTSDVKLMVYNILGKEISVLVNKQLNPGTYEVTFDASQSNGPGSNFSSGLYFYKLIIGNEQVASKIMTLIK